MYKALIKWDIGEVWSQISHIPRVAIDDKFNYEPQIFTLAVCSHGFQILRTLAIGNSEQIKSWLQFEKTEQGLYVLSSPEDLSTEENCVSLISFPKVIFLMNNQRYLKIENSRALKSLPQEIMGNNSQLEKLCIKYCDSLSIHRKQQATFISAKA